MESVVIFIPKKGRLTLSLDDQQNDIKGSKILLTHIRPLV